MGTAGTRSPRRRLLRAGPGPAQRDAADEWVTREFQKRTVGSGKGQPDWMRVVEPAPGDLAEHADRIGGKARARLGPVSLARRDRARLEVVGAVEYPADHVPLRQTQRMIADGIENAAVGLAVGLGAGGGGGPVLELRRAGRGGAHLASSASGASRSASCSHMALSHRCRSLSGTRIASAQRRAEFRDASMCGRRSETPRPTRGAWAEGRRRRAEWRDAGARRLSPFGPKRRPDDAVLLVHEHDPRRVPLGLASVERRRRRSGSPGRPAGRAARRRR